LEAVAYTPQFDEAINERVNLDQFNRFWAVETWVGQPDGYAYGRNNYRVYFDPGDEYRAVFMPWDHDWAFYTQTTIETPYGLLATACKADVHCFASFQEYLWSVSTLVAESGIHTQLDRVEELIDPWIAIDPRREISVRTLGPERTRLRQWLDNRDETLELYFPQ